MDKDKLPSWLHTAHVMPGEALSSVISHSRLLSTLQRDRQHCGTLLDHRVTSSSLACITEHRRSGCSAAEEGVTMLL